MPPEVSGKGRKRRGSHHLELSKVRVGMLDAPLRKQIQILGLSLLWSLWAETDGAKLHGLLLKLQELFP